MDNAILYKPIGVIRSEHVAAGKPPIQPVYAEGCKGTVEILPEFAEGLRDLEGFSNIYLIYHPDFAPHKFGAGRGARGAAV